MNRSYKLLVGDTVRFTDNQDGDIGVVTAYECWLNDDKAVPWNGVGEPPACVDIDPEHRPCSDRVLVRVQEFNPDTGGSAWARGQCLKAPHNYPWCWERDLELVSSPEIRVLNDSGEIGSVIGRDPLSGFNCISDSEEGARAAIALAKAARCLPLEPAEEP